MHHRAGLARILANDGADIDSSGAFLDALVAHAETGTPVHPDTTERERALLVYALELTRAPARMTRADVEAMRAAGLDDGEILDANQVTAYFAYANRVVDGLGVELEGWHTGGSPSGEAE